MERRRSGRGLAAALAAIAACAAMAPASARAQACPIDHGSAANALYVYFPLGPDSSWITKPKHLPATAQPFDVADLPSYNGGAEDLKHTIADVVRDSYCEFDVDVRRAIPSSTRPRRAIVAVGSDSHPENEAPGKWVWGDSYHVDTGDTTAVDYAYVWAGSRQASDGGPGGALVGSKGSLARWAASIGGDVAHEAGHLYGVSHSDGEVVRPGEDPLINHIMPNSGELWDLTVRGEYMARFRHHNDRAFEILAANIGLTPESLHNWTLVNPNAREADGYRVTFLTTLGRPQPVWVYSGNQSPWIEPELEQLRDVEFKGKAYNQFQLTWRSPQSWRDGEPGVVPGGATFHVGVAFAGGGTGSAPVPVVIRRSELLSRNRPLPLQPRLPGYAVGRLSRAGQLPLVLENLNDRTITLSGAEIMALPRILSLDQMLPGGDVEDWRGDDFDPYPGSRRTVIKRARTLRAGTSTSVTLGRMRAGRSILERVSAADRGATASAVGAPDSGPRRAGWNASLFPATATLVEITVVDPQARVWDPAREEYAIRPLESTIWYQLAGFKPDLNRNGVDDAIDVARRPRSDRNRDGVPDSVQR